MSTNLLNSNFICANKEIKQQVEKNLKLLKKLVDKAVLTNLTNFQSIAIKDAKVVVLDLKGEFRKDEFNKNIVNAVTILEPQAKTRE